MKKAKRYSWVEDGRRVQRQLGSMGERALWMNLLSRADKHLECWETEESLAKNLVCSERHVRRLRKALEDRSVITYTWRSPTRGGEPTGVYTLFGPLASKYLDIGCPIEVLEKYHYKKDHNEVITMKISDLRKETEKSSPAKKRGGKNAQEIQIGLDEKKAQIVQLTAIQNAERLSELWCILVKDHFDLEMVNHGVKERSQLKLIIKKLGPEKATEVVKWVIRDWSEYIAYVKIAAGIKYAPSVPHVGFLLKYCGEAVNKSAGLPKVEGVSKKKVEAKPKKAKSIVESPATLEEVLKILGEK